MRRSLQIITVLVSLSYLWWDYATTPAGILMRAPGRFYSQVLMIVLTVAALLWGLYLADPYMRHLKPRLQLGDAAKIAAWWMKTVHSWIATFVGSAIVGLLLILWLHGNYLPSEYSYNIVYVVIGLPAWLLMRFLLDQLVLRFLKAATSPG